jgi:hypothetical protein
LLLKKSIKPGMQSARFDRLFQQQRDLATVERPTQQLDDGVNYIFNFAGG